MDFFVGLCERFLANAARFGFRLLGELCRRIGVTVLIADSAPLLGELLDQFQEYTIRLGFARYFSSEPAFGSGTNTPARKTTLSAIGP
jgi:hypothetical protein